ncbi:uncharacterized protein LOC116257354 [Nymphaea colorata]|uniref:uncharacterized protein LOC116257354 n=1 Tax=Nymphaea colorata TaxID=210225 RepID=UPI00129D9B1A|nr:uncharacterized protein LOC116257354 [Nymphaea colorata]
MADTLSNQTSCSSPNNLKGGNDQSHGTLKITSILLNHTNYLSWAKAARLFLSGRCKVGYITGRISPPPKNDSNYEVWESENDMVMAWLMNSMEPHISSLFLYKETAKEIWDTLKEMYSEQNNLTRVYQLQLDIANLTKDSKQTSLYLNKLRSLYDELAQYRPATADADIYQKRFEEDKIFKVLVGLGPDYESLRSQILMTTPLPNFNQVCQAIQREDTRRKVMNPTSKTELYEENHEKMACLARFKSSTRKTDSQNQNDESNFQRNRSRLKCTYCKKTGHRREKCWELVGKPVREKMSPSQADLVTKDDLEKFFQKFSKTNLVSSQPVGNSTEECDIPGSGNEEGDW